MKKLTTLLLVIALVTSLFSITVFAKRGQADSLIFTDVNVESTESEITIDWNDIKSTVFYEITDGYGNVTYNGKRSQFTDKNLPVDSYKSYYLTGYNAKKELVTERVAISAKTKRVEGDQRSFNYMITTEQYFELQWEPIKNKKESYKIYRDDVLLVETNDTTFKDTNIVQGNKYSYSVETIVLDTEVNEQGESVTFDKTISYKTNVDTSKVNNDNTFSISSSTDANTPTILFKTFIRASSVYDPQNYWWGDDCGNDSAYFGGDGRGFSYTSNSYRTKQQVNLNFSNNTYSYSESAGETHGWCKRDDGSTYNHQYATADMAESSVQSVMGNGTSMSMNIILSENNPLVAGSPSIDADIDITVYKGNGTTTGTSYYSIDHDGFPDYEIYRKDGTLTHNDIYKWDAAAHNDGITSLGWPMEHSSSGTVN
jgi:hypothetical protein